MLEGKSRLPNSRRPEHSHVQTSTPVTRHLLDSRILNNAATEKLHVPPTSYRGHVDSRPATENT
jgi:hypothetical protein